MDSNPPLQTPAPQPSATGKRRGGKRPNAGGVRPGAGRPALSEKAQVVQLTVGATQVHSIRTRLEAEQSRGVTDKELKAAIRRVAYQALLNEYGNAGDTNID